MKMQKTIQRLELHHELIHVSNGEEALLVLQEHDTKPDLLLLDLNMPKMNGIEFLSALKKDEVLRYLPTVILTTSINKKDMLDCYKIGVSGYISKPLKYEDFVAKIEKVLAYWSVNELVSP